MRNRWLYDRGSSHYYFTMHFHTYSILLPPGVCRLPVMWFCARRLLDVELQKETCPILCAESTNTCNRWWISTRYSNESHISSSCSNSSRISSSTSCGFWKGSCVKWSRQPYGIDTCTFHGIGYRCRVVWMLSRKMEYAYFEA